MTPLTSLGSFWKLTTIPNIRKAFVFTLFRIGPQLAVPEVFFVVQIGGLLRFTVEMVGQFSLLVEQQHPNSSIIVDTECWGSRFASQRTGCERTRIALS